MLLMDGMDYLTLGTETSWKELGRGAGPAATQSTGTL